MVIGLLHPGSAKAIVMGPDRARAYPPPGLHYIMMTMSTTLAPIYLGPTTVFTPSPVDPLGLTPTEKGRVEVGATIEYVNKMSLILDLRWTLSLPWHALAYG